MHRDGADTPTPPYIGKAFIRSNVEDLILNRYLIMVASDSLLSAAARTHARPIDHARARPIVIIARTTFMLGLGLSWPYLV